MGSINYNRKINMDHHNLCDKWHSQSQKSRRVAAPSDLVVFIPITINVFFLGLRPPESVLKEGTSSVIRGIRGSLVEGSSL
ncbi:hypothetical protein H5410_015527 [Solanum commersonii]|uniref:Uncharacterized protein n=1 Tax=Solanum commersonii TaxID=4109 RepID=A0A9J5ZUS3_SOLCO|nr:hypothetical protein H5410_015527 [Solanum commersonii]